MAVWNRKAIHVPMRSTGPYALGGGRKLVWHSTEGNSAAGAFAAYRASGAFPHFTADITTLRLYQHLPISQYATALRHPPGTGETNRDMVVQVEIVGFAAKSGSWTDKQYAFLADLARWVEANHGVAHRTVNFQTLPRMTWKVFHAYSGHLGHRHVPGNDHTDPGVGFKGGLLLKGTGLTGVRARLKRVRASLAARKKKGLQSPGLIRLANRLKKYIRTNR